MTSTALPTGCPLDCPDACSLVVDVEDGRVVRLDGDERNPFTQGFICGKVRRFPDHLYGSERLRRPRRRVGERGSGRFEPISWDDALEEIASRIQAAVDAHGGEAVLPYCYGGSNGPLTQDAIDARFFGRLGASRLARTVCAAPTSRAFDGLYGKMPGVNPMDYPHSRLIVVWGFNPSASGIHLVPPIREAQKAGARLVVVDPRRTPLAQQADLHLAVRPGTDLPVAMALIHWLFENGHADRDFLDVHASGVEELRRRASAWTLEAAAEEAGVAAADLERLARWYADSSPAVVRCGYGLERNANGGSAAAAILALPAVAGKFGMRGGGFTMSTSAAYRFNRLWTEEFAATRTVNMNQLGRALNDLDDPPISVLFVYNSNALATTPDQNRVRKGLMREDLFTVVFDQVMTDTAALADVILPATTFLEHHDLAKGYGAPSMTRVRPVVAPFGEARSNNAVFGDLEARLGLSRPDEAMTDADVEARLLGGTEAAADLDRAGVHTPGLDAIPFVDHGPRTPDGRIHLVPEALDAEAPGGLYHYRRGGAGLALISPASGRTVSSTFGQLEAEARLAMSPEDAIERGLMSGDEVVVENELGRVVCSVEVTDEVRPGVVSLPKGLWSRSTINGATANALCPDTLTDLGGGACFNDARVEVKRRSSGA